MNIVVQMVLKYLAFVHIIVIALLFHGLHLKE